MSSPTAPDSPASKNERRVRVVVATTVLLSFISFWRASAIVLNDLGSTAFYIGGIVEQAVGKSAPWFILGVMLFSYTVRAVYIESSAMFVRGGVYRVVKEAMGGTVAKLSVSALLFDYVLTGPISGVSAGQYLVGLINDVLLRFGAGYRLPVNETAAFVAILITVYFWRRNTQGMHESSDDALKIMKVTTVMVVLMIVWCGFTVLKSGGQLPPAPVPHNLHFSDDALGWFKGTVWPSFLVVAIMMGFGHSILAMSGEESLAQVYREIEHPKIKNLKRTGMIIFVYSLLFTSLVSFLAVAIIPDSVRPKYYDNLISGLAMHSAGPMWARLGFQAFVVLVGFLILAGAVNTAIVGSNGVLNRVSEDRVLTDWFRKPHKKYGTTYRLINMVVILQLFTIIASRGNVYVLGEAYAFGVVWSFAFKALAMLVLRFTEPNVAREWRVPPNIRVGGVELPIGLALITIILFTVAILNLFTKQTATIAGVVFTLFLYTVFVISERVTKRKAVHASGEHTDQFQVSEEQEVGVETVQCRPGNVLVAVRDYNTLHHFDWVFDQHDAVDKDIVVLTAHVLRSEGGTQKLAQDQLFSDYEQLLFTKVVAVAERHGRTAKLVVAPASNIFDGLVQIAIQLKSSTIVIGESSVMKPAEQAHHIGEAWDRTPHERELATRLVVIRNNGAAEWYSLGAHAPVLAPEDVEQIHRIWVEAVEVMGADIHHRDIVTAALTGLEEELHGAERDRALSRLQAMKALQGTKPV